MKKKIIDMRKGIATQTILLLLIGIVVVGILIYLVYRSVTNPSLSEEQCRARLISQCTMCKNSGWTNLEIPQKLRDDCAKGVFIVWKNNDKCDSNTQIQCKALGVE